MFYPQQQNWTRGLFVHAPVATSSLLLIGMMIASLFPAKRAHAQGERTPEPEKIVVAQAAKPAVKASGKLSIVSAPNRNYTAVKSRTIDTVVLHYMSGINVDRNRWDDPALAKKILKDYRVSAHYLIARDGTVYKLVNEHNVAWHAGGSIMPAPDNRKNVNSFSIGIEIIATHNSGFTEAQYSVLTQLMDGIRARHPIRHVVGHDEISGQRAAGLGLRKDVKPDPGPLFDWSRVPGR
jgi:N-acetyl-anhydromuramyl-L-alanine amidase AmpD